MSTDESAKLDDFRNEEKQRMEDRKCLWWNILASLLNNEHSHLEINVQNRITLNSTCQKWRTLMIRTESRNGNEKL